MGIYTLKPGQAIEVPGAVIELVKIEGKAIKVKVLPANPGDPVIVKRVNPGASGGDHV